MRKFLQSGFSLIEMVLTIALLGILVGVSTYFVSDWMNAKRYVDTQAKMEALYRAILGSMAVDANGRRVDFGYHGDMGNLPTNLTDLQAIGAQAAWVFNATYGFGSGWRGPYLTSQFSSSGYALDKDEWGHSFVWSPAATPPTLVSYAADNASGGNVYAKDITIEFGTNVRLATVRGMALDSGNPVKGETIRIRYPSAGTLTSATTTTDATNGDFSFTGIPMGVRSLEVTTTTPALGPRTVVLGTNEVDLGKQSLNFSGSLQKLVLASGPSAPGGGATVQSTVTSRYESAITLDAITCWWNRPTAFLYSVLLDATTETPGSCATSGTRVDLSNTQTLTAGQTGANFYLAFKASDCTTDITMAGVSAVVNCRLEWTSGSTANVDNLTLVVP